MKKFTPRTVALSLEYHLFKKDQALLRRLVPAKLQAMLRRRARAKYLVWDARPYNEWMSRHLEKRRLPYAAALEPGLLSLATPVWDGTPLAYLQLLAKSIADQNTSGAVEWVVLDNGCTKPEILRYLAQLARQDKWVSLYRERRNEGIVGGLRTCLERARGRYMGVVDSDDLLYPDCLQIVQWWIKRSGFAPLFYSDEDKLIGTHAVQPYFKPDFDPVLLLNSAYIAHLGVFDRAKALQIDAYSDRTAEGSPDWDCFLRFHAAGFEAVHIPEVVYSWRMHPESTADDAGSKPYIHSSQRSLLERYLDEKDLSVNHKVRYSPLLPDSADWWIERLHADPLSAVLVSERRLTLDYPGIAHLPFCLTSSFKALMTALPQGPELIVLLDAGLQPERDDAVWEAHGLFERFPDCVMAGGWIAGSHGQVADGPLVLGFNGACGCPDAGRPVVDPGYFTQMRKQRSVSAITSRFAILRKSFLREALESGGFPDLPVAQLGPWLGKFALTRRQRIVFSPFLHCDSVSENAAPPTASLPIATPDLRYYPRHFGLTATTAYRLEPED